MELVGADVTHAVKLKIAKVRASKFAEILWRSTNNHESCLALGHVTIFNVRGLEKAVCVWKSSFPPRNTLVGYGEYELFKNRNYSGEYCYQFGEVDGQFMTSYSKTGLKKERS